MTNFKEYSKSEKFPIVLIGSILIIAVCITLAINLFARLSPNYYAGNIFNKKIPLIRFQEVHQHLIIENRMGYGSAFEKFLPILNLENKTWTQLIMMEAAKRQGISVTDKEVIEKISQYPSFHKGGKFDTAHYNMILRQVLQINPQDFEETIRESLLIQKLNDQITGDVTLSEEEILKEYQLRNQKIGASYCVFAAENYKEGITPSAEEISAYYKDHQKELRVEPSINIAYIRMDFPQDGGVQKEVETKYKAKAIVEEFAKNPDLAKLAEKYKFEAKESGFFSKNSLFLESGIPLKELFESFKTPTGKIQPPVNDETGYTVYLIKEKRKAYIPTLKQANDTIVDILVNEKAEEKAMNQAKEILVKVQQAPDQFLTIAKENNLETEKVPLLPKEEYFYALSLPTDEEKKLVTLTDKNPVSEILKTPKGPAILYVDQFEDIDMETFEKEKKGFAEMVLNRKKLAAFGKFTEEQMEKADKQPNPSLDFLNTLPEEK